MVEIKQDIDLRTKDAHYVWHGMRPYNPEATMIGVRGEGAWVIDNNGKKYLDAMAGLWCVNVGHGREELAKAAYEQLKELAYFPLTQSHGPAIQLAEKLNDLLGDEYVIFFSNSGSEANETAFKIARQYHQQKGEYNRYKIISRYRAYHGNTLGTLAATGQAQRKYKYEPLAPGFLHVAPPDSYRNNEEGKLPHELESVKNVDNVMTWELSETIAAMIMEPIISGGGVLVPPDGYMKGIQEVCKKHGALFIVDEVVCGFGRTGKPFGFMNYGVTPDIITMAKGLTSAYLPLSATAVRRDIFAAFQGSEEYDFLRHVNTFGGSTASCALALKNLEIMGREDLFEKSSMLGEQLLQELKQLLMNHPYVGDVRGKGLLIGIELVEDKKTKIPLQADLVNQVVAECKENGVIIGKNGTTVAGYNNVLTVSPPLSITAEEIKLLINVIVASLKTIQ